VGHAFIFDSISRVAFSRGVTPPFCEIYIWNGFSGLGGFGQFQPLDKILGKASILIVNPEQALLRSRDLAEPRDAIIARLARFPIDLSHCRNFMHIDNASQLRIYSS
jgi:hypothetical protein